MALVTGAGAGAATGYSLFRREAPEFAMVTPPWWIGVLLGVSLAAGLALVAGFGFRLQLKPKRSNA